MGTSPDVGGRTGMGKPLQHEYQELEAQAQTQVFKQGLAIVPNTIDIPFTQFGGNVWKYDSNASKPALPRKVLVATHHPELPMKDPAEERQFDQLMNKLPLHLSLALKRDRKRPYKERDPQMIILERILLFMAKSLLWIEKVKSIDIYEMEEIHEKNRMRPFFALREWTVMARDAIAMLEEETDPAARKTNREILSKLLSGIEEGFLGADKSRMQTFKVTLGKAWGYLDEIEKKKIPALATITENLVHTLMTPLIAVMVPQSAAGLYSLGEVMSNTPLSASVEQIIKQAGTMEEEYNELQKTVIPLLLKAVAPLFSALVFSCAGIVGGKEDARLEKEAITSLAMRLAACVISESQCVETVVDALIRTVKITGLQKEQLVYFGSFVATNTLILGGAGATKNMKTADPLLKGVYGPLKSQLLRVKGILDERKKTPAIRQLNIAVRQAHLALTRGSAAGYVGGIQRGASLLRIPIDVLLEESVSLATQAQKWLKNCLLSQEQGNYMDVVSLPV